MDSQSTMSGPFLIVGSILLIIFCLLWATPLTLTLLATRSSKLGASLDRQDRTEAMVFCYTLAPEKVQQIHRLPALSQKQEALKEEYLHQNPQALDVEAKAIVKIYLELYGSEVGEGYAVRQPAALQAPVQQAADAAPPAVPTVPVEDSPSPEKEEKEAAE